MGNARSKEGRHPGAEKGHPGQSPLPTSSRISATPGLACLLALLCAVRALADNNYASTNRLNAVWEGQSNILATTSNGMFRASRAEKKWVHLTPPTSMPIQGTFTPVPTNAGYVLFVAVGGDSHKVAGIYVSQDEGSSWRLLSKDYAFTSGYATQNGTIYALADGKILMSTNSGKSWRDLSAGVGVQIVRILPDPDHPNLVCLLGESRRAYVLQADDEQFKWKLARGVDWKRDQPNDDRFFASGYSTTSVLYNFLATLDNYFNYDFGGTAETSAFRLKTDKSSYTFKLQKPKPIRVTVVFYPSDTTVKFVDLDRGAELWSIKVKTPATNYVYHAAPDFQPKYESGKKLRTRRDFRIHDLKSGQAYDRSLDLDDLFKFVEKGRYKVQLGYDSIWIADRNLEEWPGSFTGIVFEVVIE